MSKKIIRKSLGKASNKKKFAEMRQLFLIFMGILIISFSPYHTNQFQLYADPEHSSAKAFEKIEGLWSYETLKPKGGEEMSLIGLFLFTDGYFLQQSINDGDPFEQQAGMAHGGTYKTIDNGYEMVAEIGISVMPKGKAPLSIRRNTEHQIFPQFLGDRLILTFGSGTIQTFRRAEASKSQVIILDKGYLGFAGSYFILVTALENAAIAGSGTFEREGNSLRLHIQRWFSVLDGQVSYLRDQIIDATFDGKTFSIADGPVFQVKK